MFVARFATPVLGALAVLLSSCAPEPNFPDDYQQSYQRVVDCVGSADHNLTQVVIYASPEAAWAYHPEPSGAFPLPEGTVLVKEEYSDPGCTQLTGHTSMRKLDDWIFQRLDKDRQVIEWGESKEIQRCSGCHSLCGADTDGLCGIGAGE